MEDHAHRATSRPLAVALGLLVLAGCGGSSSGGTSGGGAPADPEGGLTVSLAPVAESGVQGTARFNPSADSMTVKLELLGVQEGQTYPVRLSTGACDAAGDVVAELDTPHVGTVGVGSSMSRIAAASLESGRSYSIHVTDGSGSEVACGAVSVPE